MLKFLIFILGFNSSAFISTDTAVLMELVTTTASQLNELEKLVSNAERYTQKMQKYNELAQDEYFRAERVMYLAQSVATKKEVEDLGGLNSAISDLKYSMADMKGLLDEYQKIKTQEKSDKIKIESQKVQNANKKVIASKQVERAINVGTHSGASRLTAQNTGLILEESIVAQNNQLKMIEQNATRNRLLAEELEKKRMEEIKKVKFYGGKNEK